MPLMTFPEEIETRRLILRRWRPGDRAALVAIWSDPDVWRALQPGLAFDSARAERGLEEHLSHLGAARVWRRGGGRSPQRQIAGWVGVSHPTFVPQLAGHIELGWTLRRGFWGRGLASEGAEAALAAALSTLEVDEVSA